MSGRSSSGNYAKYLSYKMAHVRMKEAIEARFPLEAVAIAESIITDRLLSFVNFHGAGFDPEKATLGIVAQKAAKICRRTVNDPEGVALAARAELWARSRNAVLHAIAKSGQGVGPKIPADEFVEHAQDVAVSGQALVKDVKTWLQAKIRRSSS